MVVVVGIVGYPNNTLCPSAMWLDQWCSLMGHPQHTTCGAAQNCWGNTIVAVGRIHSGHQTNMHGTVHLAAACYWRNDR